MPRTFSLDEANALIPSLTKMIIDLHQVYEVLRDKQKESAALEQRIKLNGGMARPRVGDLRGEIERLVQQIDEQVRAIHDLGCELKDIEMGLIDFPSVREDRVVYLCWKLGESEIGFWHETSTGFAGRTPI